MRQVLRLQKLCTLSAAGHDNLRWTIYNGYCSIRLTSGSRIERATTTQRHHRVGLPFLDSTSQPRTKYILRSNLLKLPPLTIPFIHSPPSLYPHYSPHLPPPTSHLPPPASNLPNLIPLPTPLLPTLSTPFFPRASLRHKLSRNSIPSSPATPPTCSSQHQNRLWKGLHAQHCILIRLL